MHLTANDLLSAEMLLKFAISQLIPVVAFVFLVRALYSLLNEVERGHVWLMATLALIAVLVAFLDGFSAFAA